MKKSLVYSNIILKKHLIFQQRCIYIKHLTNHFKHNLIRNLQY